MSAVLLTVRNVSDSTGLSELTIRKAINAGTLIAKRVGKSIRVKPSDLDLWVESLENVTN